MHSLREILHRVAGNFARRQKLGVIVAGGKTERWAVIGLYDTDKIAADLILRPFHAADAVVVGGNRRRPVTKFAVGVTQIAGRADGGSKRIEALINPTASGHESFRCGFGELPHAHGAGGGFGRRLKRGFDMRQVGQIFRQAGVAEYFSKLPVVAATDLEPVL